jgi:hypothetical protein
MKHFIILFIAVAAFTVNLKAQEVTSSVKPIEASPENVVLKDTVKIRDNQDTTIVRMGNRDVKVINHGEGTEILWGKDKNKKCNGDKFEGHWQGLDLGFNGFANPDYSMYNPSYGEFMSLKQEKSYEVGLNLFEQNIGLLQPNIGLVTGIGFTFNDYKFENKYTIYRDGDLTKPLPIEYSDLEKTKLSVVYLNVPLLLEFQIPVNNNEGRIYVNAGILGAVKIGSHTKVKHGDIKDKDHDGFNINSFKYDATARIGYKDFGLYAKYSLGSLFETGKGPGLTPFTVGVSFSD